jgi:5'-3' exonuclease
VGDPSDNIKGIKGLGEKKLYEFFPDIKTKPVTIDYIFETAKSINEERQLNKPKLKPLTVCENILNKITDGVQGEEIYEINEKIIDLKKPLLTEAAKEEMDNIIHSPIDPEGRSMENLYKIILENKIHDLMGNKFSSFFSTYKKLVDNELEFYSKNMTEKQ